MPDVAIAIVSYNTRALLDECLTSLRPDADAGRADVWVVDNASTDDSADMVEAEHPWASLIRSQDNLGYGPAVNVVATRTDARLDRPGQQRPDLHARRDRGAGRHGRRASRGGGDRAAAHPARRLDPAVRAAVPVGDDVAADGLAGRDRSARASDAGSTCRGRGTPMSPRTSPGRPGRSSSCGARRGSRSAASTPSSGCTRRTSIWAGGWRRPGWTTRYEPRAVVHHHESAASKVAFGGQAGVVDKWVKANNAWMVRRQGLARTWASSGHHGDGGRAAGRRAERPGAPRPRSLRGEARLGAARPARRPRGAQAEAPSSSRRAEEPLQHLGSGRGVLHHPPVPEPVEDLEPCAGAAGGRVAAPRPMPTRPSSVASMQSPGRAAARFRSRPSSAITGCAADRYSGRIASAMVGSAAASSAATASVDDAAAHEQLRPLAGPCRR